MSKRLLQIAGTALLGFSMLGAGTPGTTFDKVGHKLMCPCGCAEILLECNHVGCPDSDRMISELRDQLGSNQPESAVLKWFEAKYGPTIFSAPIRGGFDSVAWIVPFAVLAVGTFGVALLVRLWRQRQTPTSEHVAVPGNFAVPDSLREQIRRDTDLR